MLGISLVGQNKPVLEDNYSFQHSTGGKIIFLTACLNEIQIFCQSQVSSQFAMCCWYSFQFDIIFHGLCLRLVHRSSLTDRLPCQISIEVGILQLQAWKSKWQDDLIYTYYTENWFILYIYLNIYILFLMAQGNL